MNLKSLKAIAEELNEKLQLDPVIDVNTTNIKQLEKRILTGLKDEDTGKIAIYTTDKATLSDDTWKYLIDDLGIEPLTPVEEEGEGDKKPQQQEKPKGKSKSKGAEEKAEEKPQGEKKKGGKKAQDNLIERTIELVAEGKHTHKELQKKLEGEFPNRSAGSISTILSDSKNPKYTRLGKTSKEDADGKLHF